MLIVKDTLEDTFTELISASLKDSALTISPIVESYIVEMLANLSSGTHTMAPRSIFLTDLLYRALDSDGLIRREYLRITGDVALFVSGIFPDSLESRKTAFKLGNYIEIGQVAYSSIQTSIFDELSVKFPEVVDVLNTVSIKIDLTSLDIGKYLRRRRAIDARITRR